MTKGVYALIIENSRAHPIQIGKLGTFLFPQGLYVYIGSALGSSATSLEHRLQRHLSKVKTIHWHIDFLLCSEFVEIIKIYYASSSEKKECHLVSTVVSKSEGQILIPRFGASDCIKNCGSHLILFQIEQDQLTALIQSAFLEINLKPLIFSLNTFHCE